MGDSTNSDSLLSKYPDIITNLSKVKLHDHMSFFNDLIDCAANDPNGGKKHICLTRLIKIFYRTYNDEYQMEKSKVKSKKISSYLNSNSNINLDDDWSDLSDSDIEATCDNNNVDADDNKDNKDNKKIVTVHSRILSDSSSDSDNETHRTRLNINMNKIFSSEDSNDNEENKIISRPRPQSILPTLYNKYGFNHGTFDNLLEDDIAI